MAKKQGAGLGTKAPVSDNKKRPGKGGKGKKGKNSPYGQFATPGYAGLNDSQSAILNQGYDQDFRLGGYAQGQLGNIEGAYANPYDWNSLPSQPVQGDFNNWRQEQIDANYGLYKKDMEPEFQQQMTDFEQTAAQRGWDPKGELYQKEKSRIETRQQRDLESAKTGAINMSGQTAGQFYDIGTAARGNALSEGMMQRNMPLSEYSALRGAQSGLVGQDLGYSQALGLQGQDHANQRWMMKNQPMGGGGGGSGGAPTAWQKAGFATLQDYNAYLTSVDRDNQMWSFQNDPKYRQPDQPSYGSQLGGQLLGTGLGMLGMYAGKNWF